jgi:hypothetical protein
VQSAFFLAIALALPVGASAFPPSSWFPLDPGTTWSYAPEGLGGKKVRQVLFREGDLVRASIEGQVVGLRGTPDAVDIEIPGEGLVPFYRFAESSFVHRDLRGCDDGAKVTAAADLEDVIVPAGTFAGCLLLHFDGMCIDGGRIAEWWAPDVGLVKWVDASIAGPRSWVLESLERKASGEPFIRGDSDGSGGLDISDAIFTLEWLFAGGSAPSCEDAADLGDDGGIDISDPIVLLGYLFLGQPAQPPPGPDASGYDPTPDDPFPCGDPPPYTGTEESLSGLAGVRFDLSTVPSVLTVGGAARGASIVYRTVVDDPVPAVTLEPLDAARCDRPDPSGLAVLETISGGDEQVYCLCDTGRCMPGEVTADLVPGAWETVFPWDGRNWRGPSDTMNPEGPPFPPGIYRFEVRAAGSVEDPGGGRRPFEVTASKTFLLVP